jgi:type II secretory pathway component PulK
MPSQPKLNHQRSDRRNERGAALISVLLISALLLSAGGVLLLTTSMSATNAIDATAEMQAYYAAEAGLQRTLNVMRTKDIPA